MTEELPEWAEKFVKVVTDEIVKELKKEDVKND